MWSPRRRSGLVASNETLPSGRVEVVDDMEVVHETISPGGVEVEVVQNGGRVGCSLFEMW